MEILLKDINELGMSTVVVVSSKYGNFKSLWGKSLGVEDRPLRGKTYNIELDIDEETILSVERVSGKGYIVETSNDSTTLVVQVEEINESILTVRLGLDILLLDYSSPDFKVGDFLKIVLRELTVYDTNI